MQKVVQFLSLHEVITIHDDLVKRFGGMLGVRDIKLLESAIYQPQISIEGEFAYKNLFEMASSYSFGIIKNHPFLDGNKRTGMLASFLFLKRNDTELALTNDDFYRFALLVANSKINQDDLANLLQASTPSDR